MQASAAMPTQEGGGQAKKDRDGRRGGRPGNTCKVRPEALVIFFLRGGGGAFPSLHDSHLPARHFRSTPPLNTPLQEPTQN